MDDSCGVLYCEGKVKYRVFFTNKPEMWVCDKHKKHYEDKPNVREIISLNFDDVEETIRRLSKDATTEEEKLKQGRLIWSVMECEPSKEAQRRILAVLTQEKKLERLLEYRLMAEKKNRAEDV